MSALLLLMLGGCGFDLPDPAKLSLDYHIDRPRVVAMRIDPPVLQPGIRSEIEVLYLDPDRDEPDDMRWELCGLRDDVWVVNFGLDCFGQSELVTEIGCGNPITWSPEPSDAPCDSPPCGHYLPLLLTTEVDEDVFWSASMVQIYGEEVATAEDLARPSLREEGVELSHEWMSDGHVELKAVVDARFEVFSWRWYVDDGVLLKTGRTATQGSTLASLSEADLTRGAEARIWTDNVWEVPDEAGSYRAVIVVAGRLIQDVPLGEDEDTEGREGWFQGDNPDQAWAVIEVEVP